MTLHGTHDGLTPFAEFEFDAEMIVWCLACFSRYTKLVASQSRFVIFASVRIYPSTFTFVS